MNIGSNRNARNMDVAAKMYIKIVPYVYFCRIYGQISQLFGLWSADLGVASLETHLFKVPSGTSEV